MKYRGGYESLAVQGGAAPAGSYKACLEVYESGTNRKLGGKCIDVVVKAAGALGLISPRDGDTIRTPYPQFLWLPPSPMPSGGATYTLKLVPVLEGQSAEDATRSNHPQFAQTGLLATSLTYPTSATPLDTGNVYAWQVQVVAPGGNVVSTSAASSFLFGWGTPGKEETEAYEELLKKLSKLLPGIWKTIAKEGITIAGAVGRYIADQAWAATVNQWQALTQEKPGELLTPAPNTWPKVRIIGVESNGRSYLIVVVLGDDGKAKDVYIVPCPFSSGFGEFGLTVGSHTRGLIFETSVSEYTIKNTDLIPITDVTYEFDKEPDGRNEPSGWDSEKPGGDDKKVRFYTNGAGILPGQSVKFEIEPGSAKLKSITASYRAADGTEKQGYTMRF